MFRNSAVLGQHFAFAHGRAGVLQQILLLQTDLDRLLGAHDVKEVHTILLELPFTKLLNQSARDPDSVIAALGAWVRTEVTNMVPKHKRAAFDILWLEGDAPLLAYLLKERLGLTSAMSRKPTPAVTAYDVNDWTRLVSGENGGAFPVAFKIFIKNLLASEHRNPASIDDHTAAFLAEYTLTLARASGSPLLVRYVRHGIDIQNMRTSLRFTGERKEAQLLSGGTIDPSEFEGTDASIASLVRRHGFYALADTLEAPDKTSSAIERALSDIRAQDIGDLWNRPLKIEPIFAFAAVAFAQLSLLRAILIGKQSALSPQEIKRLLPPFLSATHYVS